MPPRTRSALGAEGVGRVWELAITPSRQAPAELVELLMKLWVRPLVLVGIYCASSVASGATAASSSAAMLFSPDTYLEHVRYLSDDSLGGRLAGSEGGGSATDYVAEQFRELGLKPAGVAGTFFQPFEVRALKNLDRDAASFFVPGLAHEPRLGEDWTPMPFTQAGDAEGPLAFAGYCIEAADFGYDDFDGFDADGKVLLALRGEPTAADPQARFGGESPSSHALFATKARVAASHGARALLIVNDSERGQPDELFLWRDAESRTTYDLPMLHVSRVLADMLLSAAGEPSIAELEEQIERACAPRSRDLDPLAARIATGVTHPQGRNVVALLPGDGTSDELLIVGAHHDHVGTVPRMFRSDAEAEIHNGADDNASGTAGVIEMARALACGPTLRRSVLFMTFDAEELGLIGSHRFVDSPTVDLSKAVAMVNFDMIGRADNGNLTIFGVPTGDSFRDVLNAAAEQTGLEFEAPQTAGMLFRQSDHASFYDADIPVLFACTMLHPQYHQPEDDWELVDSEGAVQIVETMTNVVSSLANASDPPAFVKFAPEAEVRRRGRSADAGASDAAEATPSGMPRVRLGIMPSYEDRGPGVLVDSVVEGTPAARAGLRAGDRIVKLNGAAISDMYGYMNALKDVKPGDQAEVTVSRGSDTLTVTAAFPAPESAPAASEP
ncbi:MAG: M28 family peptidase [Phycisphaerae bacterium]|jgi:hypothetical protein